MHIVGVVRLISPAHQTAPGGEGKTIQINAFDAEGIRHQIPIITGNSLRGRLRRLAAEHVFSALKTPISRSLFHLLTRGASGRGNIERLTHPDAIVHGLRHVFAGLFGGGPAMLPSRYSIGPLLPMLTWTQAMLHPTLRDQVLSLDQFTYTYTDGAGAERRGTSLVSNLHWTARDPLIEGAGSTVIKNYAEALAEWLASLRDDSAAKKADKAKRQQAKAEGSRAEGEVVKSDSLQNFGEIEVLPPGLPLQFWLSTDPLATEAQEGLLLLALRDWARLNSVGGGSARGLGRHDASGLSVYDGNDRMCSVFDPNVPMPIYELNMQEAFVARRVHAAEAALAALTVENLETVLPTSEAA